MLPFLLKPVAGILPLTDGNPLRRCLASLSLYIIVRWDLACPVGSTSRAAIVKNHQKYVPEVESSIWPSSRKRSESGMKRYVIDTVDIGNSWRRSFSMAFERKVHTSCNKQKNQPIIQSGTWWLWNTYFAFLSSTYWIAHLPSILPTANPVASGKQLTTLVCHLRGLWMVLKIVVGLAKFMTLICRSAVPVTSKPWQTSRVYTRSCICTVAAGCCWRRSQYLRVLSQDPVTSISPAFGAWNIRTQRTGSSWAATCWDEPVVRSYMRAALSAPPETTFVPSWRKVLVLMMPRRAGVQTRQVSQPSTSELTKRGLDVRIEPSPSIDLFLISHICEPYYPKKPPQDARTGGRTRDLRCCLLEVKWALHLCSDRPGYCWR